MYHQETIDGQQLYNLLTEAINGMGLIINDRGDDLLGMAANEIANCVENQDG